jgi:diguanylate cyclase (GGDEF)-like protein
MIYFAIERRHTQSELIRMAKTDALTGAANRIALYEYVDQARIRAQRHEREFAVLVIDLDRFKQLNDQYGHAYGDAVLINVVNTLKISVRESDLVARIGGDEFVVVLDDVGSTEGARGVMQKIVELLHSGFMIDGRSVAVDASIGLATWPRDGDTIDALLAKADASMYAQKRTAEKRKIKA